MRLHAGKAIEYTGSGCGENYLQVTQETQSMTTRPGRFLVATTRLLTVFSTISTTAILCASSVAMAADARKAKPNIVLILTDDQGWADTSVPMIKGREDSRSDFYRTPALERLAREGMVFSNAYSPAPVCSPARHSIQFGKTPARLRNTCHIATAAGCPHEVSIARMIKGVDPSYATAHFGKWGLSQTRIPLQEFGYDRSDGRTNNYHGDWRSTKDKRALPDDDPKQIFGLARRACAFIEEQAGQSRPFYVQISHYALHAQHAALAETVEKWRRLPRGRKCRPGDYLDSPPPLNGWILEYAAMIENMDTSLATLLDKLDELGLAGNTYVILIGDNGGGFRGNAPLRGGKGELWEGGIRVPMVARGPGIKPGSYCDVPVVGWDFFATFSELLGNTAALPAGIDGGSLRPLFENAGAGAVNRPREYLVWHYPFWSPFGSKAMSAIRQGDWKLVKLWDSGETRLFNLAEDIGESRDLAGAEPDKVKDLHAKLIGYLQAVDAEDWREIRAERQKRTGGAVDARRRVETYLKEAEQDHPAQLRKRIEQLGEQLARQNEVLRQSVHSQHADAKDTWARANSRCAFLRSVIGRLQERLRRIDKARSDN